MSDPQQDTDEQRDTPELRLRVAALLLKLSPLMFALCYVLAAVQGAQWQHSLLISVVGTAMCLGAAGLYKLRGSKSASDLVWINILLRLFTR
ncbi:MAG: hypothetical protein NVV83_11445 [Afipia sp.]|nr:hypothetical protein [Afipia sp.]